MAWAVLPLRASQNPRCLAFACQTVAFACRAISYCWTASVVFAFRDMPAKIVVARRGSLTAVKKIWGERVTTVFPKQGHHALDPRVLAEYPAADIELARIADLTNCDLAAFLRKT